MIKKLLSSVVRMLPKSAQAQIRERYWASQKPSSLSVFVQSLLKCDIEGAELLFLENYEDLLGKVRNAVFELHHEQCDTN